MNVLRLIVWPVLLLLAAAPARADVAADLRTAAQAVIAAQHQFDRGDAAAIDLDSEIGTFSRLIENGGLNPVGVTIAHYWRGRARDLANWARVRRSEPVDAAIAREALADLDRVLATGVDVPEWRMTVAGATFTAGSVARNHLQEVDQAYAYWDKCAKLNHAGCLNIIAAARLTGAGGLEVDLEESVELNRQVYQTGTDYTCAGAYSALAIAHILHFAGIEATVDPLQWVSRAYLLIEEIGARDKVDNPCGRARFEIHEYLLRLGRGEERPQLLASAARRVDRNDDRVTAQYLLGKVDEPAFRAAAATMTTPDLACDMYFAAFWHARTRGDAALAQAYADSMSRLGGDYCSVELALAGLQKKR